MNFALFLVGLVVQTLCGSCWKTLERGFDGKGVAVLPQSETINNVEEESVWKTLSFCKCTIGSHILTIFKNVSICRSSSTIVASSIIIVTVSGFQKHMSIKAKLWIRKFNFVVLVLSPSGWEWYFYKSLSLQSNWSKNNNSGVSVLDLLSHNNILFVNFTVC